MEPPTDKGNKSETLLAAAELERRKHESNQRLGRLEQEHNILKEIRDSLAVEEKLLDSQLATAEEDLKRLAQKIEGTILRIAQIEEQIGEYKGQIAIGERRCSENQLRERQLQEQIYAAENILNDELTAISFAKEELETGRTVLARMDQRLSLSSDTRVNRSGPEHGKRIS